MKDTDTLIEALPITVRTFTALDGANIKTVAQLFSYTPKQLLRLKGFGIKGFTEMVHALLAQDIFPPKHWWNL